MNEQQIPLRDLLSTAIAAQMVDEQLGVTCTSLPPKSKAASRGQASLSVKCQRSLQKLHHGYRTNVEHDVVARTCMTHEQRRRRKSCKPHKKTCGLLRERAILTKNILPPLHKEQMYLNGNGILQNSHSSLQSDMSR